MADELDRLARGLRQRDQAMLNAMLADTMGYRDAVGMVNSTDPCITVLVCFCLAQQRALVDADLVSDRPE